ncbi:MAG: ATP-dependent DNA helicase RecG [Clostridia bacterium]
MLSEIKGVGEKTLTIFNKLGINTARDLLNTLPKSYVDLSSAIPLKEAIEGDFCLVDLIITEKNNLVRKGKLTIFKVLAKNGENEVILVWYNSPYIIKILEVGKVYTVYGKLKINNFHYEFDNPKYEIKSEMSQFSGVHPIYRTRGLISQKVYGNIVNQCLIDAKVESVISSNLEEENKLIPLYDAFKCVHQPENMNIKKATDRIRLEKLVRRIAGFQLAKKSTINLEKFKYNNKFNIANYNNILPFTLNKSQFEAVQKITDIMQKGENLNGLLCGDVGSGKTIVSFLISFYVVDNGYQVAIMAPTELLARQHYLSLQKLIGNNEKYKIALLTSSIVAAQKKKIISELENHKIDILVGTQSLLNKKIKFDKLAFVVEDEQHKFGVAQRTLLIDKGKSVGVLTLSATPIPRSIQLVAYGDIERFFIENRFESKTTTAIVPLLKRNSMWNYLFDECIKKGGQAYIVAPKIEDVEGFEGECVNELYQEIIRILPKNKVGLLHGKLKNEEKNKILDNFAQNKISILISTTVVEVGIDVPNANIMVIMQAENFGLATMHQLRGRVGRGGQKSYCFLYTEKEITTGLNILTQTSNGLEIAEKDFDMRGSGEIFGLEQSGRCSLDNVTMKQLCQARDIVAKLDLDFLRPQLEDDIAMFALDDVSLT